MTGVHVALVVVSLLAAAFLVWALLENDSRRFWKTHDEALREALAFDEALLDRILGPRRAPDCDDLTRGRQ